MGGAMTAPAVEARKVLREMFSIFVLLCIEDYTFEPRTLSVTRVQIPLHISFKVQVYGRECRLGGFDTRFPARKDRARASLQSQSPRGIDSARLLSGRRRPCPAKPGGPKDFLRAELQGRYEKRGRGNHPA